MIISPPFLPIRMPGEADEDYLARAMVGGEPGDGAFPLSFDLNWHGGTHLNAPKQDGKVLPVCAISDGTLVYVRQPVLESSASPDHPLRYSDQWTDNGCVVIRHLTEVGEGPAAKIVFYSVYMHLSKIYLASPEKGSTVSRKEIVGEAGSIYGVKAKVHFEIIADQSQLKNLVGRGERDLSYAASQGRTDCCWGDCYYFIPPEVVIYESPPDDMLKTQNDSAIVYRCPAMPSGFVPIENAGDAPSLAAGQVQGYDWAVASESQKGLFVRMKYFNGQCSLTTFFESGAEVGTQEERVDYEYDLYNIAGQTFPRSPSAGYELLRFGRVLGSDQLVPPDAAHWRRVAFPGKNGEDNKSGWVNLNGTTVTRFSDADFPHWQGWQLVDDDQDADSHCQSPFIRDLLGLDLSKVVSDNIDAVEISNSRDYNVLSPDDQQKLSARYVAEREMNITKLASADGQKCVSRLICKFPSEWSVNDFDQRYGWLLKVSEDGPFSMESYEKLKAHQRVLGFWEEAGLEGIEHRHWHFPPKEFVRVFRKCSWLSEHDLKEIFPIATSINVSKYCVHINKTLSKYLIVSDLRRSHFFGQAGVESNQLRSMSELYNGDPYNYFRRYANAKNFKGWLGNIKYNDGADFRGRGMKQLTGRANYAGYWVYRGWLQSSSYAASWWKNPGWWGIAGNTVLPAQGSMLPIQNAAVVAQLDSTMRPPVIVNPERVTGEPFTCADTAGWFWAKNKLLKTADENDVMEMTRKIRGDGPTVGISTPWPTDAKFPDRSSLTDKLIRFF